MLIHATDLLYDRSHATEEEQLGADWMGGLYNVYAKELLDGKCSMQFRVFMVNYLIGKHVWSLFELS